jgi:DNA mismatch repair protein MutH
MNSFFILIGSICCAADAKAMLKAVDEKYEMVSRLTRIFYKKKFICSKYCNVFIFRRSKGIY